ncbi:MAG: hypothetical protein LBI04_10130, partial [Treponema sp.]|jgi:hypothetical protein|nr:hypothetical protein [Treponema sp.]
MAFERLAVHIRRPEKYHQRASRSHERPQNQSDHRAFALKNLFILKTHQIPKDPHFYSSSRIVKTGGLPSGERPVFSASLK